MLNLWRKGIDAVSECPNILVKLGGITQPRTGYNWHGRQVPIGSEELSQVMAPLMHYCIDKFGPDRCMFESNFPVDKLSLSYHVYWNAMKKIAADFSESEKDALFYGTATRVYRL